MKNGHSEFSALEYSKELKPWVSVKNKPNCRPANLN